MEKIIIKVQLPKKVIEYLMKQKKLEDMQKIREWIIEAIKNYLPEKAKGFFEEETKEEEK
ncbi:MAG: hypothetical protein ABIM49_02360 [candidate division WOR-3 bacterium]